MATELPDVLDRFRQDARLAHALNECFVELGGNHPVPYSDDGTIA